MTENKLAAAKLATRCSLAPSGIQIIFKRLIENQAEALEIGDRMCDARTG